MTFTKSHNTMFFEIFEDNSNVYLFENNNRIINHNDTIRFAGYFEYNKINFYVLFKKICVNDIIDVFFNVSCNKEIIQKKEADVNFIQENPMWLFAYDSGNIRLVKSLNDRGFFTNSTNSENTPTQLQEVEIIDNRSNNSR